MASRELRFDVSALDQASKVFVKMAAAVDRFERRLDKLDGKTVDAQVDVNTKRAEDKIGRFATDMRRKVQAAVDSLPDIELDADSTDLDRKLVDVRRRMQELADKRIGIDLSAEEAIAEARLLQTELERLGRESPDIQVQADTAAAIAQLAAVDVAVDRVDGRTATVKIDVDRSISETLIQVAQLGRALGALALPGAIVAATPQLAALGAAALTAAGSVGLLPGIATTAAAAIGTLAIGFKNFGDAVGDDPKKAAEALGKLAPAARETALAVRSMAPAWEALRLDVQQQLFEGVAERVSSLGRLYLPALQDNLSRVGESLAGGAIEVATYFERWQQVDQVRTILANAEGAIENLSGTFRPLLAAVTDIAEVGSQVFQDLTAGAEDAANGFAVMVRNAQETGELKAWIQDGVTAMGQLFSITGNVGSLLASVFRAGETASGSFLGNLDRITEAMSSWASSVQGQDTLVGLFRGINDTVAALLPGLRDLGLAVVTVVGMLGQSGVFTGFAASLSAVASAASPLLVVLGALASVVLPPLLQLAQLLAPVLVPLAAGLLAIRAASAGLDRLRSFGTAVGEARANVAGAVSPMRQLSGEMRVQAALAGQAGESHARLRGAVAAMANSQSAAAATVGQTAQAMAGSYRQTSSAVQGFADRAAASAQRAGDALGARLAGQVSRGVESIIRVPGAVADAARSTATAAREMGRSLSTGLQTGVIYARETFRDLPNIADRAMERLRTSVYDGAVRASEALGNMAYDARRAYAIAADGAADMGRKVRDGASTAMGALRDAGARAVESGKALGDGLRSGVSTAVGALRDLPSAAAEAGRSLRTGLETGVIYARETLRQLPSDAANAGRSLANGLRTGVSAAGEAVRNFGTTVASGVRTAAEGVANGLRSIPDRVQGAFSSLGSAASTAIGHLGRLAGAASGTGTAIGSGLVRAGGSLVTFLGGPWGAALVVAGAALSIFGARQQEAAAKAAEHQSALDALRGTLDSYSGAVTQATVNERASQLQKDGSLAMLDRLKVSTSDYTQATLGNKEALDRVVPKLFELTQAGIENSNAFKGYKDVLDANGISLDTLTRAAMGYGPAQDEVNRKIAAMGSAGPEAKAEMDALRDSLMNAGGDAATLAQKLGVSVAEVKQMQDATRSASTAAQDFENSLRGLTPGLAGIKDGVMPTQAMANGLRDMAGAASTAAQASGEAAAATGGVEAGAQAAAAAMQKSRDAFIAATPAAMQASGEAARLADQIGLIPAAAETNFRTNATGVAAELNTLKAQIAAVPAGKDVRVQALTDEARGQLESLGFQVEQLKDGTFVIRGNTEDARAKLQDLDAAARTPVDKPIGAVDAGAQGAVDNLNSLIQDPKTKPIDGNNTGGLSATELLNSAIVDPRTKPIDGNNAGGMGANSELNGAVTTGQTKPIDGNNAQGMGQNSALDSAVRTPQTKPINANDGGARGVVSSFIGWVAGLVATVKIVANKIGFAEGGVVPMASGGVVAPGGGSRIVPLADGDAGDPDTFNGHRLTPMRANSARIVPPRTYRVIGDNPRYNELYMPMNPDSARSQALLEIGAAGMGRQLVPKGMRLQAGPGVAIAPMAEGGMVTAARAILARMSARQPMFEDWTWRGAPAVVGQYNDALLDSMKRAGYRYADGRRFLEDYIRRSTAAGRPVAVPSPAAVKAQVQAAQAAKAAAPSVTVQTGLDVAQLKAIHAQLIGLRADVIASGQFGPQLVEQMRAWTNRALAQLPATMRSAAQRDLAEIGGWNT